MGSRDGATPHHARGSRVRPAKGATGPLKPAQLLAQLNACSGLPAKRPHSSLLSSVILTLPTQRPRKGLCLLLRPARQRLFGRCTHLLQTAARKFSESKSVLIITSLQATSGVFTTCGWQQMRWKATEAFFKRQQKDSSLSLKFNLARSRLSQRYPSSESAQHQSGDRPRVTRQCHLTFFSPPPHSRMCCFGFFFAV